MKVSELIESVLEEGTVSFAINKELARQFDVSYNVEEERKRKYSSDGGNDADMKSMYIGDADEFFSSVDSVFDKAKESMKSDKMTREIAIKYLDELGDYLVGIASRFGAYARYNGK